MSKASQTPLTVKNEPIKLVGLTAELPPRSAQHERIRVIQDLTRSLLARVHEIPRRQGSERYSVIENDVFDTDEVPRLWSMVAVESYDDIPDWCEGFTIKPGRYAIFQHKGSPRDLSQTVARIHNEWTGRLPGLFQSNLEIVVYPAGYDPLDPQASCDYWLPLP